jgi:integral membrane protein
MISLAESRLRLIGLTEGWSFLLLLFIAMPLKYGFGQPEAVRVIGSIHGALFVLYVGVVLLLAFVQRWRLLRVLLALVASVIPFGPFLLDKRLQDEADLQAQSRQSAP